MVFTALIGTKTLIKYESVSCLYHIDKVQILSFIIVYKFCVWILLL